MTEAADFAKLLEPVSAQSPGGEDFELTQAMAFFDSFRVFGQLEAPPAETDWKSLRSHSLELLDKTRDLRPLAYLAVALGHTDTLSDVLNVYRVAAGWFERFPDEVYPRIEDDGLQRRNSVACLADPISIRARLRRTPLVRFGAHKALSLHDLEAADVVDGGESGEIDQARIDLRERAVWLRRNADSVSATIKLIALVLQDFVKIEAALQLGLDTHFDPIFDSLAGELRHIQARLAHFANDGDVHRALAQTSAAPAAAPARRGDGTIATRDDALNAIERAAEYFRNAEPSSPISQMLDRTRRLAGMSFLQIVAEVAPDGLPQARNVVGSQDPGV